MKLDYRCRGIGCNTASACRRNLTGQAGKNSAVPYAAFDVRRDDDNTCGAFLPRQYVGEVAAETEGGEA